MNRPIPDHFSFARYPAVRIALLLAAGIITGAYFSPSLTLSLFLLTLTLIVFIWSERIFRKRVDPFYYRLSSGAYLATLFLFGSVWPQLQQEQLSDAGLNHRALLGAFIGEEVGFKGVIQDIRPAAGGSRQIDIEVDTTILEGILIWPETYNLRTTLKAGTARLHPDSEWKLGRRIHFKATVYPLENRRNPSQFDYKKYLASKNIYATAGIESIYSVTASSEAPSWETFRQQVLDLIELNFSEPVRPLAKALLIGYKNELDRTERSAFSRAGLSHIMAVSGLHVGFIIAPFWIFIPWFWTMKYGKQAGLILLVILLAVYAGLTGFSASVSRAALTGGLITYGRLFHKVRDSINLTAVAAVILLVTDPNQLFEPGFQLSFAAVYIILLVMPAITRIIPAPARYRWHGKLLVLVAVSLVVQAGLFPLLVWYFGEFSLVGPLANALVVPALGFVIPYALILLMVSAAAPALGTAMNLPNDWLLTLLDGFVRHTSGLQWSWIELHLSSPLIFFYWTVGILLIASWHLTFLRWKLLVSLLAILAADSTNRLYRSFSPAPLTVTVFDVGQGDATLIQAPGERRVLIDTGRWSPGYNSGRHIIIPHLKANGIDRLDAVILSHPHSDHIGGMSDLIREVAVDTIYHSGFQYDSELYRNYRKLAKRHSIPVLPLSAGDRITLGPSVEIFIYGPQNPDSVSDPNDSSVILELVYGDTEWLFVGDAGREQEERLIANFGPLLDTDFLKVGHHGSKTSSSARFLDTVTPEIAVVSLAGNNRFGHPHREPVTRLRERAGRVYFTSLDRALIFRSDGRTITKTKW